LERAAVFAHAAVDRKSIRDSPPLLVEVTREHA